MDVSKYHTRYPPKEHEEAVRMLLEGLDESRPAVKLVSRDAQPDETPTLPRTRDRKEDIYLEDRTSKQLRRTNKQASPGRHQPLVNAKMLSKQMKSQADVSSSSVDSGSLARCSGDNEEDGHEEFDFDELQANSRAAPNDDLEFNSEESGSQDFIQVSPQIQPKRLASSAAAAAGRRLKDYEHESRFPVPKMQSKATSTASDSISTSGASTDRTENKAADDDDDLNENYEAIPSRTIAIQCDLKLSSVKRDGYLDSASSDLASMQASSISSTRYGFYRLSPEVLEQRRQLARSVSSRNIAENNLTNTQRVSTLARRNTIEAPTSISELSSVADVGELEPELAHLRMRRASLTREQAGELRSVGSSDRDSIAARSKHDQRFFSQRQRQQQVNSRARQDSLPRRPKTALSYVSTSRLRHQQDEVDNEAEPAPNRGPASDDDDESEHGQARFGAESGRRMLSRGRAMSQQVLSSLGKHRQPSSREEATAAELVNSNSDSELGAEKYRLPQQEELVVTRRGKTMGSSPQVSRSNAIRNGPLFRRATQQLDGGSNKSSNMVQQVATTKPSSRYNKLDNTDELDYGRKQESIIREKGSLDAQTRARPSGGSHSTAGANQLATGTTERRAKLTKPTGHNSSNNNNIMQGSRYGSMSLSRRPQQSLIEQGSCNLIQGDEPTKNCVNSDDRVADAGSGESPTGTSSHHRHSTRPMLLRRDRAGSQQVLPVSATLTRSERVLANRASSNQAGHVGRSSSMKQGRTRLVTASGDYEENSRNDYEREEMQQQQQRAAYTSCQPPVDDDDLDHRTSRRQHFEVDDDCCKYQDCCGPATLDGQMECDGSRLGGDYEFEDEREQQQKQQSWRTGANKPTSRPPPVGTSAKRSESEDSESPLTRTWANPAHMTRRHTSKATDHQARRQANHNPDDENNSMDYAPRYANDREIVAGKVLDRKSSRSHSMRDVSHLEASHGSMLLNGARPRRFETIYRAGQQDEANEFVEGADFEEQQQHGRHQEKVPSEGYSICSSSSANDEARMETLTRAQASHQPLDFDSQQRLNKIGLPEPSHSISASSKRRPTVTGSASHLGLSSVSPGLINRYATTGRTGTTSAGEHHHHHQYTRQLGTAITGRAMSQQSLTRPTMPLSRRLRRSGGTIGAGSGSDVGGSSISLVSRLRDGSRYENAHTRNPVVMLIPQAAPGHNELLRASTRRASSRLGRPLTKSSGSRVSSQDRKNRSVSRNGSDSESSSSMLRTLIKPRAAGGARAPGSSSISRGSRRRGLASNNLDSDEENQDEIGQLASEMDSYKFRRRYSVPKDAKINWFSKLKQRVTSSKS